MELSLTTSGSLARGQLHSNPSRLFPIVVAAYLWGPGWASQRVEFLCDNASVVAVPSSGTSRAPDLMVLLRYVT